MKRFTAVMIALCIILLMSACGNNRNTEQTTPATTTAPPETTAPVPGEIEQLPLLAVSVPTVYHYETTDNGTLLATITSQDIAMTVSEPEIADKIILDYLNRIDLKGNDESTIALSKEQYAADAEHFTPFALQITYNPMRLDAGILSFFGINAGYTGGPHGDIIPISINYDMTTGKLLSLYNILTDGTSADSLETLVKKNLEKQAEEVMLYEGYEQTISQSFNQNYQKNTNWYFSNNGLCFYFAPYEIGPYASGTIVAEIPYSELIGILQDAYFPSERQAATGAIVAERFDSNTLDRFTQFAEVILNKGGEQTLFYTDKCVYDVRIESGTWSADGNIFTPQHTVFAAYSLTVGDAVMVEAEIGEVLPTLRLTYTTDDGTVEQFLTYSGKDGSVFLTDI